MTSPSPTIVQQVKWYPHVTRSPAGKRAKGAVVFVFLSSVVAKSVTLKTSDKRIGKKREIFVRKRIGKRECL